MGPLLQGQNRFRAILSHCSQNKIGSMEKIFSMFHCSPPLWDNFVGQKGGAMTSFAGTSIKKDVCYCYLSF